MKTGDWLIQLVSIHVISETRTLSINQMQAVQCPVPAGHWKPNGFPIILGPTTIRIFVVELCGSTQSQHLQFLYEA